MLGVTRRAGKAAALLIVGFAVGGSAVGGTISVGWDAVDDPSVAGYRVHVGSASGEYDQAISVGNVTDTTWTGLGNCQSHYLAVKAVSYAGVESLQYSNELSGWPRPEIGSVSHPLIHPGTALEVTLGGTNFASGASVAIVGGDVTVSGVIVDSCNVARVALWLAPGAALGPRQIEIINPDGAFGAYAGLFSVCRDNDGDGAFSAECGGDDCDDSRETNSPGGVELCDGLDNDCDGSADEGGVCSGDSDGDGVGGAIDNCAEVANPDQVDSDADGWGDACDPCTDADSDGFGDPVVPASQCQPDNCPGIPNPSQSDLDGNGVGNACEPAHGTSTLLSYWSLDVLEFGDTLPDATGAGNDLRLEGGSVSGGVMSGGLELVDGQNQYAIIEDPAGLDLQQDFSLTAWIRPNSLGQNATGAIIDKLDGLDGYSLRLSSDGGLTLYGLRSFGAIYSDPGVVPPGWWHHVAVTFSGGEVRFYVDAEPVGVGTATQNPVVSEAPFCLGNSFDLSRDFDGSLDDVRVYSGALDPASIANLMLTTVAFCVDVDSDGFGAPASPGCVAGLVSDCDDSSAAVHPYAAEICGDGIDQDCSGQDLACACGDFDADGFTDAACGGADCDDGDGETHPGATEDCGDGIDQDCDGLDAECGCWDQDGDGVQDWFCGGADCDDGDPDVGPGADEACNGVDDDCDGAIDEDGVCSGLPAALAHYTMDADTLVGATLEDVTGNGHDGLVLGAQSAAGFIGESLEWLQGEQDQVVVPDADELDLGSAFTIAAWIYPETFGESYSGAILDKFDVPDAEGYAFRISNGGSHGGLMFYGASEQSFYFSQSDVIELREWQHVAVTYANGTLAFWVNGVNIGQRATLHDPRPSNKTLVLGNNQSGTRDFDGLIDELRLYDVALTLEQLQELVGQ